MTDIHIQLLQALKKLQDNGPTEPQLGICFHVLHAEDVSVTQRIAFECLLESLWVHWPKFSGEIRFPVPHPVGCPQLPFSAITQLNYNRGKAPSMWEGEYGNNRKELLAFLISELEK